jgi:hypothetical protein
VTGNALPVAMQPPAVRIDLPLNFHLAPDRVSPDFVPSGAAGRRAGGAAGPDCASDRMFRRGLRHKDRWGEIARPPKADAVVVVADLIREKGSRVIEAE